jgi:1-phosphatidylinositol-4-phosphate 5-kinase
MSTSASSGKGTSHISADGFLHPPQPHRPARRNTTGSAMPWQPLAAGAGGSLAEEGAGGDGELATDIQARAEQIRRERQSKRAKALQQAEKALTRSGSKSTVKETEDGGPLVGNLIGEDHVNYVLMYNMLTGIRIAVSRCQAKIKRPLTDEDFAARHKYSFDM